MFKRALVAAALVTLSLVWVISAQNNAQSVIDNSMKAMGIENLKTIMYVGDGWDACVGQAYSPNAKEWRKFLNKNYVRSVDFDQKTWRLQRLRTDIPGNSGGCSAGPYADQQQNQVVNGGDDANFNNQMEYIMLPLGFLQTAAAKGASVRQQGGNTVLTFPMQNGDSMVDVSGTINRQGYVERVETKIYNAAVFGDMVWDATFSNYQDFDGVKWPTHIAQTQGGLGFFDLTISEVRPNATIDVEQQAKGKGRGGFGGKGRGGRGGGEAPSIVEDLGSNAWLIKGGYASIVVEMADHVIIVEGASNDARGETVMAEAKRLVPDKPIRYVINTHHHSDHSGGLREYMAEGVTIMTHSVNKNYMQKVHDGVHTLGQDNLAKMNPKPALKIETFGDRKVITDAMNTIEIHKVANSTHAEGMVMIYLPKQKVLLEADEFNVAGQAPTTSPNPPNPYHVNMLANIERLKLDVDRIIPVHLPGDDRKVTMAELRIMAGHPN